jgi:glutamate synthase domain-containing protein 1
MHSWRHFHLRGEKKRIAARGYKMLCKFDQRGRDSGANYSGVR